MADIHFPDRIHRQNDLAVIWFNHGGSVSSQDSGRDASRLAHRFEIPFIAVDRPGSGYRFPSKNLQNELGADYKSSMQGVYREIRAICALNGISRVIAAGRSMGGMGAVAFAAGMEQRGVRLAGVYTAEMAGCGMANDNSKSARADARQNYRHYLAEQKLVIKDKTTQVIKPEKSRRSFIDSLSRGASMLICNMSDYYNNDQVLGSTVGLECAEDLAANAPRTYLQFDFAAKSAVARQETIDSLESKLRSLRTTPDSARIYVSQPQQTVHASFDNIAFLGTRMEMAIAYSRLG